jgi:hypothetical protein
MMLDSAFADLTMLAEEMVEKGRKQGLFAPGFVVKMAIRMIRSSVQKMAGFDIRLLSPIEHADRCFIPALFVAAEGDDFVPPHHRLGLGLDLGLGLGLDLGLGLGLDLGLGLGLKLGHFCELYKLTDTETHIKS